MRFSWCTAHAGCQDIDDALHARRLPNGHIEAGVRMYCSYRPVPHLLRYAWSDIADVSHFVHSDTAMDSEAAARGTTVYLVDKRIDMLPALLGTNLCSLRPHVERLAFSVIWVRLCGCVSSVNLTLCLQELDSEAQIVNVRFAKSVIASKSAFTYEEAQIRKDDPCVAAVPFPPVFLKCRQ